MKKFILATSLTLCASTLSAADTNFSDAVKDQVLSTHMGEDYRIMEEEYHVVLPLLAQYYLSVSEYEGELLRSGKPLDYAALWAKKIALAEKIALSSQCPPRFHRLWMDYIAALESRSEQAQQLKAGDAKAHRQLLQEARAPFVAKWEDDIEMRLLAGFYFLKELGPANTRTLLSKEIAQLEEAGQPVPLEKALELNALNIQNMKAILASRDARSLSEGEVPDFSDEEKSLAKQVFPMLFDFDEQLDLAVSQMELNETSDPMTAGIVKEIELQKQFFPQSDTPAVFSAYWLDSIALNEAMLEAMQDSTLTEETVDAIWEEHTEAMDEILLAKHPLAYRVHLWFSYYCGLPHGNRAKELSRELEQLDALDEWTEEQELRYSELKIELIQQLRRDWLASQSE